MGIHELSPLDAICVAPVYTAACSRLKNTLLARLVYVPRLAEKGVHYSG